MFAGFKKQDAVIIGVSMDTLESHRAFAKKHDLQFPLLADTKGELAAKYGVRTRRGFAERVTFVIDKEGKIAKVFPHVHVSGHAGACLDTVKTL